MGSEHWQLCSELCARVLGRALDLPALQGEAAPRCQGEAWEMPWAPGAGQFVVHPVTWGVQAWARLSTRAAIAGGSFLSVLQESRNCPGAWQGETALAAFLGEGDSCLLHFPGSGGLATALRPSLLQRGASCSLTPDWAFLPLHLGMEHLGLCLPPQPKC